MNWLVFNLMDVGMHYSELGHGHDPVGFSCSYQSAFLGLWVVDLAEHHMDEVLS